MNRLSLSQWLTLALVISCGPASESSGTSTNGNNSVDAGPSGEDASNNGGGNGSTDTRDEDGDGIADRDETATDTDGDGVPNNMDDDSDGDGIADELEAGDSDPKTAPKDTDRDGIPDYLDPDSDDDGVSDATEQSRGTNPANADSDGDGADDLTEIGAGTDPLDGKKNPTGEGNFYFRVPYAEPPMPAKGELLFRPEIRAADIYFLMDSSVSMNSVIAAVKKNLSQNILPGVTARIPDVQVGAGEFDDCPNAFVSPKDVGVRNVASSTKDAASVATAMGTISADGGPREPYGIAAWLWATGDTKKFPKLAPRSCAPGLVGYGCVRSSTLPILVVVGDELYSQGSVCDNNKTPNDVAVALNNIGAKLIVMGPTADDRTDSFTAWKEIAQKTGSVDDTGKPLFFASRDRAALEDDNGSLVVSALEKLASAIPLELTAVVRDDPSDAVDATKFVAHVDAYAAGGLTDPRNPNLVCVSGLKTSDRNADTFHEYFDAVKPGTAVCFELIAAKNNEVMPTAMPQVFKAFVDVKDALGRVYDTRDIYFLVPPAPPAPGDIVIY